MADLPDWATCDDPDAPMPVVDVDAHEMYPALLAEYAAHYEEADGPGAEEFDTDEPTAYALEVCYQSCKLDLWMAMGTATMEIRVHDEGKTYAQADHPDGRGPEQAAGGLEGGKEAREHYKNLRGFLPV